VIESSSTPLFVSLQLVGIGTSYDEFNWAEDVTGTFGFANEGQAFADLE